MLANCSPLFLSLPTKNQECVDINACLTATCTGSNVVCVDKPAPAGNGPAGRTCECASGFILEDGVCKDIDACIDNPCPEHSTCTDLPGGPNNATGRACMCLGDTSGSECTCGDGYEADNNHICKEIDACIEYGG